MATSATARRAESSGPPCRVARSRSVSGALAEAARKFPAEGVVTIGDGGQADLVSYPDLLRRARGTLSRLLKRGCGPGDPVVIYGLRLPGFFPVLWGCLLGGLVPLPVCAPGHDGPAAMERVLGAWRLLRRPPVLTDPAGAAALAEVPGLAAWDVTGWCDAVEPADAGPAFPGPRDRRDTALMLTSSGSTGAAKLIPLTHGGLLEFAAGSLQALGWRPGERTLNWLPVDHSASLLLYHLLPVFAGCTGIHVPARHVLADPLRWLDLMARHRVNHSWAPTFGYQLVRSALAGREGDIEDGARWDLSGIRTLVCGGEQITPDVVDGFLAATARFGVPPDCFVPSWGMAETCTGITWARYGGPCLHHVRVSSLNEDLVRADEPDAECVTFVSVGKPAPGARVRVVDAGNRVLPEGRIGRLQVRSKRVTPGYLADLPEQRQPGGWFDTGDQAFVIDGEVVVTGREKDVVIVNGQNHYCHQVEEIAGAVDGVRGRIAAACAVADPGTGSEGLAIFFAPDDARPAAETARAIGAELTRRLRLVPRAVLPLAAGTLPHTPSGKVRRGELTAMASAALSPPAPSAPTPPCREPEPGPRPGLARAPIGIVCRGVALALGRDAGPGQERVPFYELGLTSVTLVRLHAFLQDELGLEFPAAALFEYPSPAELARYLAARACPAGPGAADPDPPRQLAEPVAIIGMALRFPSARTPAEYWSNLLAGKDCVTVFGPAAQRAAGLTDEQIADSGRLPVCGALDDVDHFDPAFFGMSPKEAALTDPAHRLFLECCYEALETAGHAASPAGRRTAVFAGTGMNLYGYQRPGRGTPGDLAEAMAASFGGQPDFLAARVAYRLGLTGPAVGVQTACSTSLVAVHLAAAALRNGDADLALAGAAAVHRPQEGGYRVHPGSVLSPTGRCRPFDARADGTVGGNGVGVVLLRPLAAAIAAGDPIHAVITGSAVNNDGTRKVGFAAPSVSGQADAIRAALRRAGVTGDALCYVEAHGTGTALGDPVEFEALSQALRTEPGQPGHCALGSVKASIGHLDTCAGMAGLIKVVLMLQHRTQVPTVNLERPNPALALAGSPVTLATDVRPLRASGGAPLRAGVNSLGVGGTNAFVVVQEPPPVPARPAEPARQAPALLPLSGNTVAMVRETARGLGIWLRDHPGLSVPDVVASMAARPLRAERSVVLGRTLAELSGALGALAMGEPGAYTTGRAIDDGELRIAFACCGQGRVRRGMARTVYDNCHAAREVLRECAEVHRGCSGVGLLAALLDEGTEPVPAGLAQPMLYALQVALIAMWRSWGLEPGVLLGQSMGEIAALAAAGALSVADGMRFCTSRGRLMAAGAGGMLAVAAGPVLAEQIAGQAGLEVAVRSGSERQVLSGDLTAIARGTELLDQRGLPWRKLDVDVAYHSALLDPLLGELSLAARGCRLGPLAVPFISGVDGAVHPAGSTIDTAYLVEQARRQVRLDLSFAALEPAGFGAVVEIGPAHDASTLGRRAQPGLLWLGGDAAVPQTVAQLFCQGAPVAWRRLSPAGRRITLPASALQRTDISRGPARVAARPDPAEDGAMNDEKLLTVLALTAGQLGLRQDEVGPDQSFVELGADSLILLALAGQVSERYGIRVPVSELFAEAGTPRGLALAIASRTPGQDRTDSIQDRTEGVQPAPRDSCDFSIYFFGDYPSSDGDGKYQPLLDAAEFADRAGFHAIWFPERHFHSFGALFPNPSVLGAALAVRTSRIRLNAGSVVLPLHNPIRVAEEWSMVDNLSGGRVGLCLASGWSANDFVLAPENYGRHKQVMYEQLATLRRLWAGERVGVRSGTGERVEVTTLPRPVQPLPPLFTAVVSNPDSYRLAARNDLGVVTNLMSQSVADLAANIELYRRTRAECGLDPRTGRVVVLVHTYLAQDRDQARREAFGPFCDYLRSSLSLFDGVTNSLGLTIDLERTHPEDVEFLLGRAFSRYCDERALIGSPRSCQPVVQALVDAGADELGCLIDFGVPAGRMLDGLPVLDALRARCAAGAADRGVPLSDAQRRLWLLDKMYPGRDTYHESRAILLDGPLEADALRGALTRVAARHPQLRAVIRDVDGEPQQFIAPAAPVSCEQTAMEGLDVTRALRELVLADAGASLDLAAGPLFLARLVRLGPERHLLYLLVHHIVFDSLSTAIFCRDLAGYYRAWPGEPDGLPPLPAFGEPPAPADSQQLADGLAFWGKELAGAPVLSLPADRPRRPGPSRRAGSVVHEFGAELTDAAAALAKRHGCTLFMTLLGALGAVLGRLSGQQDVVLGTAMTSRPAGTEELIGMFVDTVVLRLDLSGEPDAATLLRRVRDRCGQAYEHRDVPFDKLVSVLNPERVAGVNPLFQVMVEFEDAADLAFDPPRLRAEILDVASERAAFDVSFLMTRHAGGLRCTMTYDAGLFDDGTIRRMLDYTQACLRRMADDPAARLPELTALTGADRVRLNDLNSRSAGGPPACLHQLFEEQVARTPAAPALTGDAGSLSYGELDTAAGRLAGVLTGYGVRRNSVVGVCLPRGSALIIALLAVLKAGGAYLPLDPALPGERLRQYLADSSAVLVLADRGVATEPNPFGGVPVHVLDDPGGSAHGQPAEAPETAEAAEPDDMAYCIYTSGSTGPPKAVAVPHRGPVNLVRWQLRNSEPLRTLWWNSAAFDLSVQEIFTTLASGAALVTIGDSVRGDMAAVGEAMRRHGVQRVFMPFTPLNYLAAEMPSVPSLRELYAGGEQVVITPALRRLLDAHPGVRLFNQYGPTEASVIVTSYQARGDEDGPLPIGRPISNLVVRVLDPDGRPVPVGASGELSIGGDALATGYLGDPVRTARAFIPDPDCPGRRLYRTGDLVRWRSDGELEFRGRNDDQVKIRGYRVSPGEVRWALGRLAGLRDSAVVVRRDRHGEPRLAAYVVPAGDAVPGLVPALRDQLRATLPSYLIPGEWVTLPELPAAPNGKLAADRLPEPAGTDGGLAGEPPVTPVERRLHELWCAELGVPAIGRERAFFDCGGNSLTAVRLLSRVRDEFGCQLSLAGFMSEPTIEAMGRTLAGLIPGEN